MPRKTKAQLLEEIEQLNHQLQEAQLMAKLTPANSEKDLFRHFLDSALDPVHFTDRNGLVIYANAAHEKVLGYRPDEIIGKQIQDFIHPSVFASPSNFKIQIAVKKFLEDGQYSHKIKFIHKDGHIVEGHVNFVFMVDEQGELSGLQATFRNIADHRKTQMTLLNSEKRFKKLTETIEQVFWMTDPKVDNVLYVSPAYEKVWGRSCESLYADPKTWGKAVHPDDLASILEAIKESNPADQHAQMEYRIIRPDGAIRWIRNRSFPIQDDQGNLAYFAGVAEDITEAHLTESALRQSEAWTRALIEAIPDMIFQCNAEGKILYFKPGHEIQPLVPPEKFLNQPFSKFLPDEVSKIMHKKIKLVIDSGQPQVFEYQIFYQDSLRDYEARAVRCSDCEVLLLVRDITQKKQSEKMQEVFQRLSHRLTAPLNRIQIGQVVAEEVYQLLHHDAFTLMLVDEHQCIALNIYLEDTFRGQNTPQHIDDPGSVPFHTKESIQLLKGQPLLINRQDNKDDDIGLKPFGDCSRKSKSLMFHPVRWEGQTVGIISVQSYTANRYRQGDLAVLQGFANHLGGAMARMLAEDALRRSELRFRRYFELGLIGVAVVSPDRQWLDFNDRLCEMLGYTREQLINYKWTDITHPDDLKREMNKFNRVLAGETNGYRIEKRYIRKDGQVIDCSLSCKCIRRDDGQVECFVAFLQDITKRKKSEDQLRKAREELEIHVLERTKELQTANANLVQSRERLQAILDALPGCLAWVDCELNIDGINKNFADLLKHPIEELRNKNILDLDISADLKFLFQKLFEGNQHEISGEAALFESGNPRQFLLVGRKYHNNLKAVFIGMEITQRKRAEDALRRSEERYHLATTAGKSAVWDISLDTGQLYVDKNIESMLGGYPKPVYWSDAWLDIIHPDDRDKVTKMVELASAGKINEFEVEHRFRQKSGRYIWVISRGTVFRHPDGSPRRMVGTVADITERKIAALALFESEYKYRMLFEDAKDGIYIVSRDGRIMEINPAMLEMMGISRDEAQGARAEDYYADPHDRLRFQNEVEAKGSVRGYKLKLRRRDGKVLNCLETAAIWRKPDGTIGGYQGIIRDVTEQTRAEEERRRLDQMRRDFVSNVSHEFKTPLTAIRGYAETLLDKALGDTETCRKFLDIILSQAIRLQRLTDNLLKLSRLDEGNMDLNFQQIAVPRLIQFCLDTIRLRVRENNLRVKFHSPANLPLISGDAWWLRQVFQNLLDNAVEYSKPGGEIVVTAESADEHYVSICVQDSGIGIPEDKLPHIFERFYRGEDSRSRRGGGTGLGLSIVKELVREHNGYILVESEPDQGTQFKIFLPKK